MDEILTLEQIKEKCPDEWCLVECVEVSEDWEIIRGKVLAHSPDRDVIYGQLATTKANHVAVEYTGEIPDDWAIML